MTATANERKQAERERRKALGLVRLELWVYPEEKRYIQQLAEDLPSHQAGESIRRRRRSEP